jgi:gamma-glutamylcyclotransferase (GGCT)/AIG2-like uncharacterized protein YtfP
MCWASEGNLVTSPPIDIFVYGTLLRDESNHHFLAAAEFLGNDCLAAAQLFHLGDYPMMINGVGVVIGEVYRISLEILQKLDILEEHPDYYQRSLVTLQSGRNALTYWGRAEFVQGFPLIASGSWRHR